MAVLSFLNPRVEIAGTDMSTFCKQVELSYEADDLETTTFGSGGARTRIQGLRDGSVSFTFNDDFAATTVDDRVWGWFNTGTPVNVRIRPTSAVISAANPEYRIDALPTEFMMGGAVGDLLEKSLTWPTSGVLTRAVA
jgi:hypothetical protein